MALNTNKALTMTQSIINCSDAQSPIKEIYLYFLQRKSMFISHRKFWVPPFSFHKPVMA